MHSTFPCTCRYSQERITTWGRSDGTTSWLAGWLQLQCSREKIHTCPEDFTRGPEGRRYEQQGQFRFWTSNSPTQEEAKENRKLCEWQQWTQQRWPQQQCHWAKLSPKVPEGRAHQTKAQVGDIDQRKARYGCPTATDAAPHPTFGWTLQVTTQVPPAGNV